MATIREIELSNFMPFEHHAYVLPERGLVLVGGENGKGKSSSTVEAVSWGLYGKVVRDPPPRSVVRRGQGQGSARVVTADVEVRRTKNSRVTTLELGGHPQYETTTKAQAALEQVLGMDVDTWRRTHVVTSKDVDKFSTSTDQGRKLHIESVIGLGAFGDAHALARKDRQALELQVAVLSGQVNTTRATLEGHRNTLLALARQGAPTAPSVVRPEVSVTLADVKRSQEELQRCNSALAAFRLAKQNVQGRLAHASETVIALGGGTCPVCGQEVQEKDGLEDAVIAQVMARAELEDYPAVEELRLGQAYQAAGRVFQETTAEQARQQQARASADDVNLGVLRYHEEFTSLNQRVLAGEAQLEKQEAELVALQSRLEVATHIERVLSARGFRIHALGEALKAISELSTFYLQWFNPAGSIRVRVPEESDKVVIDVIGYGEDTYGGCSDGQRRRIDLCLVFAMSMLSPSRGTLFLDEALDHVDAGGVAAAVRLLRHLADDRCVILISFNPALIDAVEYVQRITI